MMNNPAPGASRPIDPDDPWAGIEPAATGASCTIVDIDVLAGEWETVTEFLSSVATTVESDHVYITAPHD